MKFRIVPYLDNYNSERITYILEELERGWIFDHWTEVARYHSVEDAEDSIKRRTANEPLPILYYDEHGERMRLTQRGWAA